MTCGHAGIASCTESASARTKGKAPRSAKPDRSCSTSSSRSATSRITVEALCLVGHGLSIHDQAGGDAVAELARIAAERLQVVEEVWKKVLEARRGQKR
jgi:hypothetical protein